MRITPETLARSSARHPWRVIVVWVLVTAGLATASSLFLTDALTNDIAFTNEPESVQAMNAIEDRVTGEQANTEFLIVRSPDRTVDDPAFEAYVERLRGEVAALGADVIAPPQRGQPTSVLTVYDLRAAAEAAASDQERAALEAQAASMVSQNQRATIISVPIVDMESATIEALHEVVES